MTDAAPRIYLDSTIFIDAFEGSDTRAEELLDLFARFRRSRKRGVTSEFTLAELLGKVSERGWVWQRRFYLDLLVGNDFFDLRPVSQAILVETGSFRTAGKLQDRAIKVGDAIHAVTAQEAGCRYLLTSDKRFRVPETVALLTPDAAGFAELFKALDA